jgi:hypothetical protein
MQLFCRSCRRNHVFSPEEVERVVYGLQVHIAQVSDPAYVPPLAIEPEDDGFECLKAVYLDGYGGANKQSVWVDEQVAKRLANGETPDR